jgi:transcriptional regulator with XRE-family HTH domain
LLELRKKLKITQKELADLTKVSQSNYSKYEKGLIEPGYSFISKIVQLLNINPSWLISGEGEMFVGELKTHKVKEYATKKEEVSDTYRKQLEEELKKAQEELVRLRERNSKLREENQELNDEIKERFREIIGLQGKLLGSK